MINRDFGIFFDCVCVVIGECLIGEIYFVGFIWVVNFDLVF